MAHVIPFKGILFNKEKINDYADVVTPPYDVISPTEQQQYYDRHPNNVIRLDLGVKKESDTPEENHHTRAAGYFKDWLDREILVKDDAPALYLTSVAFSMQGKPVTRYGMLCLVGLEPFDKGIILPHEKTFSKVKSERFDLIKKCQANFSPIFSIYSDTDNILDTLKKAAENCRPDIDILDDKGDRHMLYRITDPDVHALVSRAMKDNTVFIADGHHRYETALNFKQWLAKNDPDFGSDHPANYVMMYLSSMEDPGLVVLPAHRMLRNIDKTGMIEKSQKYFDITPVPVEKEAVKKTRDTLYTLLKSNADKNAIGVCIHSSPEFYLFTLKPGIMDTVFGDTIEGPLKKLDVTVLTNLILTDILGFDQTRLDDEDLIAYSSDENTAIEKTISGEIDMSFILNPTKIEQVRNIASEGLIMPRKTTYFYPKAITGLVMNSLKA